MSVHIELPTGPVATLVAAGFSVGTDDGWTAEYTIGRHQIRIKQDPNGFWVSQVRIAGAFERVIAAEPRHTLEDAAQLALRMTDTIHTALQALGLVGAWCVAGPEVARHG